MNEWFYVGMICLGVLTIQSEANFTWQHFGAITIILGAFLLAIKEIQGNIKRNNK